jgi:hypothetical protein
VTLHLMFTASTPLGAVKVHEKIPVLVTAPYFGGVRYWLTCPCCQSRVRALYMPSESHRWECRLCHRLTYRSVREHDNRVAKLMKNPGEVETIIESFEGSNVLDYTTEFWLAMKASSRLCCKEHNYPDQPGANDSLMPDAATATIST